MRYYSVWFTDCEGYDRFIELLAVSNCAATVRLLAEFGDLVATVTGVE